MISKIRKILSDEHFKYSISEFFKTYAKHPFLMSKEFSRFLLNSTGFKFKANGLIFEHHCHSNFSDGLELSNVIDKLFELNISLWSLTDHDNSEAFDSLVNGKYKLDKKYEIENHSDGRSLTIHECEKNLVMLRSIEKYTEQGEINIHGYVGKLPESRTSLEDTIRIAHELGGFVVINHPYYWQGIGYKSEKYVINAINEGVIGVEMNATEIFPQIHCPVRSKVIGERHNIAVLPSGDSHLLEMYGRAGVVFDEEEYGKNFRGNHPDNIRDLIRKGNFRTYFNYLTPRQFLKFYRF